MGTLVPMDEDFATPSPRRSPKRLSSRMSSRSNSPEETRARIKSEIHLTRELIDFDVIKGSAFFHTKPSNHDRKLVKEAFGRALFVPFHAKFWKQKPYFYEAATSLYAVHFVATCIYIFRLKHTSSLNSFEVLFPVALLLLIAVGYGRVSSTLQAGDSDGPVKLFSPTKQTSGSHGNGTSGSGGEGTSGSEVGEMSEVLAESDNSDSTDSEEDSGNSSSSSDEANPHDNMFPSAGSTGTPQGFPSTPNTPRTPFTYTEKEGVDHFARRRVTVCVWENGVPMKTSMSVTELRSNILAKVKATPPRVIYRKIAKCAALTVALVPIALRCFIHYQSVNLSSMTMDPLEILYWADRYYKEMTMDHLYGYAQTIPVAASIIAFSCFCCTYYMALIIFDALADAEVTYHRRFLYAKCFTALTSSRRSRLMNMPHFRLKNVVNIKAWISLRGGRTWLKRQGRQRAADEIVSTSFLINLVLLVVMGVQAVADTSSAFQAQSLLHVEVSIWCMMSSIFMLRFMMLGSNINKKYQNTSLLLTEQMNVYLRLLMKPHKKEKLLVSNNVLKLASKLLKELNPPNKVSGLTMNPLLYNITRVVVLSAFSSSASEFFGFKLKLWKLK